MVPGSIDWLFRNAAVGFAKQRCMPWSVAVCAARISWCTAWTWRACSCTWQRLGNSGCSGSQSRVLGFQGPAAAGSCAEFLVHGVDVEGMQLGVDEELIRLLGAASPLPVTYAGGVRSLVRSSSIVICAHNVLLAS